MSDISRRTFLCTLWILSGSICLPEAARAAADAVRLRLGRTGVTLEVADTEIARRIGLMHRSTLEADHGMLFVFDRPAPRALWMKNTLIDLDAAFVDKRGRIIRIVTMRRATTDLHACDGPVSCIVEMNAGWFSAHGLYAGDVIEDLREESLARILDRST